MSHLCPGCGHFFASGTAVDRHVVEECPCRVTKSGERHSGTLVTLRDDGVYAHVWNVDGLCIEHRLGKMGLDPSRIYFESERSKTEDNYPVGVDAGDGEGEVVVVTSLDFGPELKWDSSGGPTVEIEVTKYDPPVIILEEILEMRRLLTDSLYYGPWLINWPTYDSTEDQPHIVEAPK